MKTAAVCCSSWRKQPGTVVLEKTLNLTETTLTKSTKLYCHFTLIKNYAVQPKHVKGKISA